ncbi:MAG: tocopherol cyclase family protein [Saprospiraceae bacterium]|nr:tocopherol cyclase family protein [Saprospiraceae bacterium]
MTNWIYKTYQPEIFQGHTAKKKYFEGWYFKLVTADERQAIAIIPGIAIYDDADRHAFIQIINGIAQTTVYHRFPLETFSADEKELYVTIGNNHFSKAKVVLDLPELKGEIQLMDSIPLVSTLLSPGIMGWYSFMPSMQCYHGIVSLHHRLSGVTTGSMGDIDWQHGIGYIEKDWGTSFPKCWIWLHSNHFNHSAPASLMASVAHIPWLGRYFPGFIVVLLADGVEYRFATYNGSRMKCSVFEDRVVMEFRRKDLHLSLQAFRGPTAVLRSPITGQMTGKVNESLQARVEVVLTRSGTAIWTSTGTTAGLEVAGDTTILESETWRR